jgi:hypothetical protein
LTTCNINPARSLVRVEFDIVDPIRDAHSTFNEFFEYLVVGYGLVDHVAAHVALI